MNGRRGDPLRESARLALLEIERVVDFSLFGAAVETVLDVGTGSGLFAEAFARRGKRVAGVDVDARRIGLARGHLPGGRFGQARAEALPFPAGAFDLAFFGLVLHELADPARALAEARRVASRRIVVLEWPEPDGGPGAPPVSRLRGESLPAIAGRAGFMGVQPIALAHLVLYLFAPAAT